MKPGDVIVFTSTATGKKLRAIVEKVTHYASAEEMLEREDFKCIDPYAGSKEEAIETLYSFKNYKDRIKRGGIFAIKIKFVGEAMAYPAGDAIFRGLRNHPRPIFPWRSHLLG
jgi:ASC-1-like (ASCH) protein